MWQLYENDALYDIATPHHIWVAKRTADNRPVWCYV